ncbi:MAG: Ferredoxin [Xanthobacteraceae bacterium]|nr:Ferredoxin [Xanthobacteraceae bacterium]
MIELVSQSRCISCHACVLACPQNVFDSVPHAPPVIARPDACQTCFLCELYCPADALYVSPLAHEHEVVDEQQLIAAGLLGSYARAMGWKRGHPGGTENDLTYRMFEEGLIQP